MADTKRLGKAEQEADYADDDVHGSSADARYERARRKITLPPEITAWLNKKIPE